MLLQDWELFLLQELRWELSAVTPLDFLDQILERLRLDSRLVDLDDVRRRAETALVLAATEYKYCYLNPSLLAASSLLAVLDGLLRALMASAANLVSPETMSRLKRDHDGLLGSLQMLSHSPSHEIKLCAEQLLTSSPNYLTTFNPVDVNQNEPTKQKQLDTSSIPSPSPSPPAIMSPTSSSTTLVSSTDFQFQDQQQQDQQQEDLNQSGHSILVS